MKKAIFPVLAFLISALAPAFINPSFAWDALGHRITASVAYQFVTNETRTKLLLIIESHPRFEEDFVDAMPSFIRRSSERQQQIWLLGQAAYWPDLARGFPESEREKYNKANWHYTDGAWNRGAAQSQGNQYINTSSQADIAGEPASAVRELSDAHNVSTALDYNTALLANPAASPTDRAVALCWVLHLMGDIHQPLHTGSLFSARLFRNGDRGGNGISTDRGNLHSAWDSALREDGIESSVAAILENREIALSAANTDSHWDLWMSESREILLSQVYSDEMLSAISDADRNGARLTEFELDSDYVRQMQDISRVRLGLAGIRLANWFDQQLP